MEFRQETLLSDAGKFILNFSDEEGRVRWELRHVASGLAQSGIADTEKDALRDARDIISAWDRTFP